MSAERQARAPGEIAYLTNIARPTVGILTNVEEAHLAGLGTVHGVMREKAALLEALPPSGAAILNADNYYCREIMETLENNDYLENMVAYIRRYAAEYFENSPVKLKITTQGDILPTPINGEHRRNIFYTVKEALNNILKHALITFY